MAQTRKRRRRKHRGTQAGTIETPGRTGRPTSPRPKARSDARATARQRREHRFDKPPTWRGAVNRALLAAVILAVFISITSKKPAVGVTLGVFALVVYIPMSYYTDRFLYRRRQRQKQKPGG